MSCCWPRADEAAPWLRRGFALACLVAASVCVGSAQAGAAEEAGAGPIEEIVVTGSRIRRVDALQQVAPVSTLASDDLDRAGLTNLGAVLQQLPISGSAINARFNVPGNSGFPQDGNGIGAGAARMSLRNLGAKRTLVLVDGRRWIAGASASGVPSAVDLNSLPSGVVERIEILHDGASAIYGSDAIGGVVNVITRGAFDGLRVAVQTGGYLSEGDGAATRFDALWGRGELGGGSVLASLSYVDEGPVYTSDRAQSAFPSPFGTSCEDGGCSSFTPQGRFILGPNLGGADVTLNDGALNDGARLPAFDPAQPTSGDFHAFSAADRFNYNGNRFNYLLTPNRRLNLFGALRHELGGSVRLLAKAVYARRESATRGAPEPLCLGSGCGNPILENVVIAAEQRYNPFGAELSVANGNLVFFGRRPLESGPRIFEQQVDTWFVNAVLEGEFALGGRALFWELAANRGENRGWQQKQGAHNAAKLAVALGEPSVCAATPGCVPFNFFGGQGPDGQGSITEAMLGYVGFVQRDFSEQTLADVAGALKGDLVELPAGPLAFAVGFERRWHEGSFQPDPVAERGETAGIPAGSTRGAFDVAEFYVEFDAPLLAGAPFADYLAAHVASRRSDYSSWGAATSYKAGLLWRPTVDLSLRASVSTGIRAPGIGELYGGAAREDFRHLDPCVDVHGVFGAANGGRAMPQPAHIVDNCARLGVRPDSIQPNPQLNAVSSGNDRLEAETSKSRMVGFVYRPSWLEARGWIESLALSADVYAIDIDDAIQARAPGDLVDACVETLAPRFCAHVMRDSQGAIVLVENLLQNIGGIRAAGADLRVDYLAPATAAGQLTVGVSATHLREYEEVLRNADGALAANVLDGRITSETFQRAFPTWRGTAKADWRSGDWLVGLTLRHVSALRQSGGGRLSAERYLDLRAQHRWRWHGRRVETTAGVNNVLNNEPAACTSCGVTSMSLVAHELPGVFGYVGVSFEH